MVCESTCETMCQQATEQNMRVSAYEAVDTGTNWDLRVSVSSKSVLYGDTLLVGLYDLDTSESLGYSDETHLSPGETVEFSVIVPKTPRNYRFSIYDVNMWPLCCDCEDFIDFYVTEDIVDPQVPPTPKPGDEPCDLFCYVEKYLIYVVIIVALIFLTKRSR